MNFIIVIKHIIMQAKNTKAYNVANGVKINHQPSSMNPLTFSTTNTNESIRQRKRDAFEKYIMFLLGVIINQILYGIRILLLNHHHQAEL